jgi:hypothetical protein
MSEIETTNDVETEAFTDELLDEALDRELEGEGRCCVGGCTRS